jgi:hypothetical protein
MLYLTIVFAYFVIKKIKIYKSIFNIEMAVSVFFRHDIPITSHMGITRNHSFFQSESSSTKNLSIYLHSFATKSVLEICKAMNVVYLPKYMTTRPAKVMGNIILTKFALLDESFKVNNPGFKDDTKNYYLANKIEHIWVCDEKDRKHSSIENMCPKTTDGSFPLKFIQPFNADHNNVYTGIVNKKTKEKYDKYKELESTLKKLQSTLKNDEIDIQKKQICQKIKEYRQNMNELTSKLRKILDQDNYTLLPEWEIKYDDKTYKFDIPPWYDINPKIIPHTYHADFMYTSLPFMIMDLNKLSSIF